MIVFDLKCRQDHRFQGWFRNGDAYDAQVAAGEIACPVCGDVAVEKAPMAPRLVKERGEAESRVASPPPDRATQVSTEVRRVLTEIRRSIEERCDYVGERFSEEARRIHYGEVAARPIFGEASGEQADALRDEGIEVVAVPWLPRSDA